MRPSPFSNRAASLTAQTKAGSGSASARAELGGRGIHFLLVILASSTNADSPPANDGSSIFVVTSSKRAHGGTNGLEHRLNLLLVASVQGGQQQIVNVAIGLARAHLASNL